MNKQIILSSYSKDEDKLFISKILDKWQFSIKKNKICNTNFMNEYEKQLALNLLSSQKVTNFMIYGGFENCQRNIIIFYPEKFDLNIVKNNLSKLIGFIRIELPKELYQKYSHKDYLGGIIKLGISREKIGDILVFENGADIIATSDVLEYLSTNLSSLIRFQKSNIQILNIEKIRKSEQKMQEITLTIPSLRIDSIVADLCHTSRNKACQLIEQENVYINYNIVYKTNFMVKENDVLTIRHYGKYNILGIIGKTRKGNVLLKVEKYV